MKLSINVFFASQFAGTIMPKSDKETALVQAIKEATSELSNEFPEIAMNWQECRLESGRQVGEQVVELIKASEVFIADISEQNPNVLFELGVAYGLQLVGQKRIIWLAHENVDLKDVPSNLRGLYIHCYNEMSLRPILTIRIRDLSREIIKKRRYAEHLALVRKFWGFPEEGNVDIVCSEIPEKERHYFADPGDRNYLRYAKFADLDSLIYVRTRLAQLFPVLTLRDFSASEYFDPHTKGLVIIGGPPWNAKAKELQAQLPFRFISQPLGTDDPLILEGMDDYTFLPTWSESKELVKDICVFARIRVGKDIPAILLAGCLTFGVLGSAKCFLDKELGPSNAEYVLQHVQNRDFLLVCEAQRIGGFVKTPDFCVKEPLAILVRKNSGGFQVATKNAREYKGVPRPDPVEDV